MPKATPKFTQAVEAAKHLSIANEITDAAGGTGERETLYRELKARGFDWDSRQQMWLSVPPTQPASDVLRVRVWTRGDVVNDVADTLVAMIETADMQLIERSEAYPCRAPKQAESRVYLSFMPRAK